MLSLSTPIEHAEKISKKIIPALRRLGIKTLKDLLYHFPSRYEDLSNVKPIADVFAEETVTIEGTIVSVSGFRTARKHMYLTEVEISDGTHTIKALWFNQPYLLRVLKKGVRMRFSGKVAKGPRGLVLQNPAHERSGKNDFSAETLHTGALIPVYPETTGITSRWLRFLIHTYLPLAENINEPLPEIILQKYGLPELHQALREIHFPQSLENAESAKKRFAFEELLLIQLRSLRERSRLKQTHAPAIISDIPLIKQFTQSLPFPLTDAQRRSLWEILKDMEKSSPMNRLLEGDVGSGKTVVVAGALLPVIKQGFTVLCMAPTEILARQHFETFEKLLSPFGITIGLMTGSEKRADKTHQVIVGTHAIIQHHAQFENLGLVIIDEQHRFGVQQRALLTKKGDAQTKEALLPHFLSMSATPIPRTLALTIYGDLDLSLLDEMPKSRKQVITSIVEPNKRIEAYDFVRSEIKKERQVFVICPRIEIPEESQKKSAFQQKWLTAETKAVKEEFEKLSKTIFPDFRVGMLHGKMKAKEKMEIMRQFKNHALDILVSTSVIEVGVDIPNASVMMIEGAERFGLAQLHQFRGRVGRGEHQSYCLLFPTEDGVITRRLRAIKEAKNGFELAERDLEIRGPGDLFGSRQSGIPDLALAHLTDAKLVREVRNTARFIAQESPNLAKYPALKKRLEEFTQTIHLE